MKRIVTVKSFQSLTIFLLFDRNTFLVSCCHVCSFSLTEDLTGLPEILSSDWLRCRELSVVQNKTSLRKRGVKWPKQQPIWTDWEDFWKLNKISITQSYAKIIPIIVEDIKKLEIWRSGAKQARLLELQSSSKNYRVTRKDVSNGISMTQRMFWNNEIF